MEQIFIKLLNMSISAGWMVLALLLLRPLLKKAPKWISCLLWGFVGLRLCLPVSIESMLSLIPSAQTVPEGIMLDTSPAIDSGISSINSAVNPVIGQVFAPDPATSANPLQIGMFLAAAVWIAGMVVMALYAAISYGLLRRKLREAVRQQENIWVCDRVDSPFLLGLIRPRIYLPSDLSSESAAYVIAHEQAHLKRRDHLWKPLGFLLLTVYWFNPLLWVAYILLCRDIEYACDEKVLQSIGADHKSAYSEALIRCSSPRKLISACPVAFGEDGVKGRVKSVLNYKKPAFWIMIAAVAVSVAVAVCFLTDPVDEPENSTPDFQFMATVLEVTEDSLLVAPLEGEAECNTSDRFYIPLADNAPAILAEGNQVKIVYDGVIQELYPAILPNIFEITLIKRYEKNMADPTSELEFILQQTDITKTYPLVIYATQFAANAWHFKFLKNTTIAHTSLELMRVDGMNLEHARQALAAYDLDPEDIPVVVYQDILSSYLVNISDETAQAARKCLFSTELE